MPNHFCRTASAGLVMLAFAGGASAQGAASLAALTGRPAATYFAGHGLVHTEQAIWASSKADRSFIYRPGRPIEYLPEGYASAPQRNDDVSGYYRYTPGVGYERVMVLPSADRPPDHRVEVAPSVVTVPPRDPMAAPPGAAWWLATLGAVVVLAAPFAKRRRAGTGR